MVFVRSKPLSHWRNAVLSGVLLAMFYGLVDGFAIFSSAFCADLGINQSSATTIFATYLLANGAMAPVAGLLIDRFGFTRPVLTGLIGFSLGLAAISQAQQLWHFAACYLTILAPAGALIVTGAHTHVRHSYTTDRGTAVGLAYGLLGAGNATLFPIMSLIIARASWRVGYLVAAALAAVIALGVAAYAKHIPPRYVTTAPANQNPTDAAALPKPPWWTLWALLAATFFGAVADFFVFQHTVHFLRAGDIHPELAGTALGVVALGYIMGQVSGGVISDRIGREATGSAAIGLYFAGLALLWHSWDSHTVAILASCLVLGTAVGGFVGAGGAAIGDIFRGRNLGTISGLNTVAISLGAAAGTLLGTLRGDSPASFGWAFGLAAASALSWAIAIWIAAPRNYHHRFNHSLNEAQSG